MPASNEAQNGCRKMLALYFATWRRSTAPPAALANMMAAADECCTPNSTDRATAPAAAASVNSHVGAGGACEIVPIAAIAAAGASRPAARSSSARVAEATRAMFTPAGSAGIAVISLA